MLNRLIGGSPVEVVKSFLLVFVSVIAALALQQLASTRSAQTAGQSDRVEVLAVARDFGRELTTYDYAHPEVQQNRLAPLASQAVLDKVRGSFTDLRVYRAVSVGEAPDVYLQSLDQDRGQVLLQTRSTTQSQYVPPGTRSSGLLLCELRRQGSTWRVSDYRWLTPVAEGVS